MLDREVLRQHHSEFSYLVGRFMVEHLVRVHRAFDGDVVAAIVLGTIGQHNVRLFYDEVVAKSDESLTELVARGAHVPYLRPCNAMSVAASTGIPRETVRRKIRWLIERGWIEQAGRDKLFLSRAVAQHFAAFDVETVENFASAWSRLATMMERRRAVAARRASACGSASTSGSAPTAESPAPPDAAPEGCSETAGAPPHDGSQNATRLR
jgi:hypothetical protein